MISEIKHLAKQITLQKFQRKISMYILQRRVKWQAWRCVRPKVLSKFLTILPAI